MGSSARPEAALEAALTLALIGWAAWWLVTLAVAVVDRRTAARFAPPLLRAILVGGAVLAATTPAHAGHGTGVESLDGLPLPERPVTPAPPFEMILPAGHVVQPGECLWSIVRDRSPGLAESRVRVEVARWHRANRDVIGPDPDLIHPGQRLDPPGAAR